MYKSLLAWSAVCVTILAFTASCSSRENLELEAECPKLSLASGQASMVVGSEHRDGKQGFAWSPDCAYITWLVDHGGGDTELWIANTVDFSERQLASELATSSIAFRDSDFELGLFDSTSYMRWSPTSDHAVVPVGNYIEEASVRIVDPSDGDYWVATQDAEFLGWSPDGKWLLYGNNHREVEGEGNGWSPSMDLVSLWIIENQPDSDPHLIHGEVVDRGIRWSADASAILHLIPGAEPDTLDLLSFDLDTKKAITIARGLTERQSHSWSPDASMIKVVKDGITYIFDRELTSQRS